MPSHPRSPTSLKGSICAAFQSFVLALALAAAYQIEATSLSVSINSAVSSTAGTLAGKLMSYYDPANAGLLPTPYF